MVRVDTLNVNPRKVLAAVAAMALVTTALLVGPLAERSSAAAFTVSNATEYWGAIADLNTSHCGDGPHTITVDSSFTLDSSSVAYGCDDDLTVVGATPGLTITGALDTRFLTATSALADVSVEGLSFQGFVVDVVDDYSGGVFLLEGSLDLVDTHFSGISLITTATVYGGVAHVSGSITAQDSTFDDIYVEGGGIVESASGGALSATGEVTSTGSDFSNISLYSDGYSYGGAIDAGTGVAVSTSSFVNVDAFGQYESFGGAIYLSTNQLVATDSTFTNNHTSSTADARGGAIFTNAAMVDIVNSELTGNSAVAVGYAGGGAVHAEDFVYVGDSEFLNNSSRSTGPDDWSDGGAVLADQFSSVRSHFEGNTTASVWAYGGAVYASYSLGIVDSTFESNSATGVWQADGGAVGSANGPTLIERSTFANNSAISPDDARGGAIAVYSNTKFISESTFTGNTASTGGAIFVPWEGIEVVASTFNDNAAVEGGALYGVGDLLLTNSTLTGNTASGDGGAIFADESSDPDGFVLRLTHVTLAANSSPTGAHIFSNGTEHTLWLTATVFGNPLGGGTNCWLSSTSLIASGWWDADGTCAPGYGAHGDPMLGALADNGGPTLTMQPLESSPLIDRSASCSAVDQRGVSRTGAPCEAGAVEVLAPVEFSVVTEGGTVEGTIMNAVSVTNVEAMTVTGHGGTPPPGLAFPFGVFGFDVTVPVDGWSVTVTLELPSPVTEFWKVQNGTWGQVPGAVIDGSTVTYTLTDGGVGDEDGAENSVIVDPAAPAIRGSFTG